ncbi:hypothetical protein ACKI2N_022180 [Cupriavidus sp. 30B13]|uniref:hypothetical protein n=1 Tax=Cupriavidus sp. 30B13 TaxID=3384241 RepID=UPI003B8F32AB
MPASLYAGSPMLRTKLAGPRAQKPGARDFQRIGRFVARISLFIHIMATDWGNAKAFKLIPKRFQDCKKSIQPDLSGPVSRRSGIVPLLRSVMSQASGLPAT